MTRAITPKTVNDREGLKMLRAEGKKRFCKGEGRVDDEMKGYEWNSSLLMKPLEVVLRSYLNRSGFGKGEVCGRTIEGAVKELVVRKVRLKSSKLSIRPPVLLSGKGVDEVGRIGGERALSKFRWDY